MYSVTYNVPANSINNWHGVYISPLNFHIHTHRPMYIASSDSTYPDGHQPVATELRSAIEPLLKVNTLTLDFSRLTTSTLIDHPT